jgi:hypothetical protein
VCLAALSASYVGIATIGPQVALADHGVVDCPNGDNEVLEKVRRAPKTSADAWVRSDGVIVHTDIRDRDVNTNCQGFLAGSAAQIQFVNANNDIVAHYIQIGWEEIRHTTMGGDIEITWYLVAYEQGSSGAVVEDWTCRPGQFACAGQGATVGHNCAFRIERITGDNWMTYYNCNGGPPEQAHAFNNTGFTRGVPQAKTWRFGGEATGMTDTMSGLQYKNRTNGAWTDWNNNSCWADDASNWQASLVQDTSYSVTKGSINC